MAGIISTMPTMFVTAFNELMAKSDVLGIGIALFAAFVVVYFLIIIGVIFVEQAERKIPIQYANKSSSGYANQSFMPIKVNTAGVIPVIFASSLLAIPATIAQFIKNEKFINFVNNYLTYTKPVGFIIFV